MTTNINGTNGIDKVAPGAVERGDLPAGTVLQVVNAQVTGVVSTTSTSYVTTGLSATITPTSTTSKIVIMYETSGSNQNGANGGIFTLFRGSIASGTNLGDSTWGFGNWAANGVAFYAPVSLLYCDSPATTSAVTYNAAMRVNAGITLYANWSGPATMILMEIAA